MIHGKRLMNSGTPPRKKFRSGLGGASMQSLLSTPFTPQSLSGLILWLTRTSPLWQNTTKTTAATAPGDPIAVWQDKSGLSNDGVQSTDALRPTILNNSNGSFVNYTGTTFMPLQSLINQPSGNSNVTMASWVTFSNTPTVNEVVVGFGLDVGGGSKIYLLYRDTTGKITSQFGADLGLATGTTTVGASRLDHIACVYNGSTNKVYLNGVQDATANYTTANLTADHQTGGAYFNFASIYAWFMTGIVEDTVIYNRNLSAAEILQLANYRSNT